jgi:ankyrin repeat protein
LIKQNCDLCFESQFVTVTKDKKEKQYDIVKPQVFKIKQSSNIKKITFLKGGDRSWNSIHKSIMWEKYDSIKNVIDNAPEEIYSQDRDGNTPLSWAAYRGHTRCLKYLISKDNSKTYLNQCNKHGLNALALAIFNNHYNCADILFKNGAGLSYEIGNKLLEYSIDHSHQQTILFMLSSGLSQVTDEMKYLMSKETFDWYLKQNISTKTETININLAISKGMVDVVEKLMKEDNFEYDPYLLFDCLVANSQNHLDILEIFLKTNKFDINFQNKEKETILFKACQNGLIKFIKLILKYKPDTEISNEKGNSCLWIACVNGALEIVGELLNYGADPNKKNNKGENALIPSCQRGYEDIVLSLLIAGADIDNENSNGDTAIIICCRTGQDRILDLLLKKTNKKKALNHFAKIDGFSALLAATESNKYECINILSKNGADLEQKTDDDNKIIQGATSLHLAAYYGRTESVKVLLNLGANPDSVDFNHSTPLHIAIKQGNIKIVQLLKNHNADLNIKDKFGHLPSYYINQNIEIMNILIDPVYNILMKLAKRQFQESEEKSALEVLKKYSGAIGCLSKEKSVDICLSDGVTPLMEAIISSFEELVKVLIELGANPKLLDFDGVSSIQWVNWRNNEEISKIVIETPSNNDMESIYNLKTTLNNCDINEKLILYPTEPPISIEIPSNKSNISEEMSNYFEYQSISKIPYSESKKSIIHILETISNLCNKKNEMSQLIWDSKIFTIKKGFKGEIVPSDIFSINFYTSSAFINTKVNDLLLSIKNDEKLNSLIENYLTILIGSIQKLGRYEGTVFRGTDKKFDRSKFEIGKEFTWPTFSSCSLDWSVAGNFTNKKGTIFLIKSKNGRNISMYSKYQQDNQVIFLPNTKFKVTNWYLGDVISLGQENIRNTAYKLKIEDLEKLKNNNDALIIELEEIDEITEKNE